MYLQRAGELFDTAAFQSIGSLFRADGSDDQETTC